MANDFGNKVARAARTGGGATARGNRPYGWYFVLFLILAIGIPLILVSRNQRMDDLHPTGTDHWHTALSWYQCDKYVPALTGVPEGGSAQVPVLHTHSIGKTKKGDGLVHVEPDPQQKTQYEGKGATLGAFISLYPQYGKSGTFTLTKTSYQRPGEEIHKTGDKCGSSKAEVQVLTWQPTVTDVKNAKGVVTGRKFKYDNGYEVFSGDPNSIRLRDGLGITVALIKPGTDVPPPTTKELDSASSAISKAADKVKSKVTTTTSKGATSTTKAD